MKNLAYLLLLYSVSSSVQAAEISGTVFYDGVPVPNAEIRLWKFLESPNGEMAVSVLFSEKIFTAPDGSYLLNAATNADYAIEAVPPEPTDLLPGYYQNADNLWDVDRLSVTEETPLTNINIHLSRGAIVSGIVESSGQPVSNAYIYIADNNSSISFSCRSDATGAFRSLVRPGTNYTATASPPEDSGFLSQTYSNAFSALIEAPATNINFDLLPAARISGTVRSEANLIENVHIAVYQKDEETALWNYVASDLSNTNGTYTAWVPPGTNYIVQADPLDDSGLLGEYYAGTDSRDDAVRLSVTLDSPLTGIDFDLGEAAWISGTVLNGADTVSNACVQLEKRVYDINGTFSGFETVDSTCTDGNGFYRFPVAEGTNYILSAAPLFDEFLILSQQPKLYYPAAYPRENAATISTTLTSPAENINIDLSHLPEICGSVSSSGVPVAEATVTVYQKVLLGPTIPGGIAAYFSSLLATAETDQNGTYSISLSPGSNYFVRAEAPDGSSLIPEYYDDALTTGDAVFFSPVLDQSISGIDFDLSPGFRIQGSVCTQNNEPVSDPHIYVCDIHGNSLNSTTGTDNGIYAVYAPTGTPVTVTASGSNCQPEYYCDSFSLNLAQTFNGTAGDTVTADFILFTRTSDQDGDGLMDYEEDSVPDGVFTPGVDYSNLIDKDTDHDGQNDNAEKLCKTDPSNPLDYLYIRNFSGAHESVHFTWLAESGVQYQVERCSDLVTGQWVPVSDLFTGEGILKQFTDSSLTSESAYYRIRVIAP